MLFVATGLVILALAVGTAIVESQRATTTGTTSSTSPYSEGEVYGRQLRTRGYGDRQADAACRSSARTEARSGDTTIWAQGCSAGYAE